MLRQFCVLFLIFCLPDVKGLDLPQGCEVESVLEVDPIKYDSVKFHAYVGNWSSMVFESKLTCSNTRVTDFLTLDLNHSVTLEKIDWTSRNSRRVFEAIELDPGWHTFDLRVVGKYTLEDEEGNSWIPEGVPTTCKAAKVTFSKGVFMRHCLEEVPTWVVSGTRAREIPLKAFGVEISSTEEDVVLFSRRRFSPWFSVKGEHFGIVSENGQLKVIQGQAKGTLTPFVQHYLTFIVSEDTDGNPKLKIASGTKELYTTILKNLPTKLSVSGRPNDHFVVLQNIKKEKQIVGEIPTGRQTTSVPDVTVIGLLAGLVFSAVVILVLAARELCRWRRDRKMKMNQSLTIATVPEIMISEKMDTNKDYLNGKERKVTTLKTTGRSRDHDSMLYLRPISHVPLMLPPLPPSMSLPVAKEVTNEEEEAEPLYEEVCSSESTGEAEKLQEEPSSP